MNKLLPLILVFTFILMFTAELTASQLRDSERQLLNKMKNNRQQQENLPSETSKIQYDPVEKIKQCQIVLKKIDKLSLEIDELTSKSTFNPNETAKRVKLLKIQVKRYKIQSKEFCPKNYVAGP
jgi:hypothetical protein